MKAKALDYGNSEKFKKEKNHIAAVKSLVARARFAVSSP